MTESIETAPGPGAADLVRPTATGRVPPEATGRVPPEAGEWAPQATEWAPPKATGWVRPWPVALRGLGMLGMLAVLAWAMADRLAAIDPGAMLAQIAAVPTPVLLAAGLATLASHLALSGYDLVAFRQLGVALPAARLVRGGFAATTLGQVLGFGLITGALARWRLHGAAGVTPAQAVAASGLVAAGFFAGLGVLMLVVAVLNPGLPARVLGLGPGAVAAVAGVGLALVAAVCLGVRGGRRLRVAGLVVAVPDGRWLARCSALAAADLVPAAATLWLVLPQGVPLADLVAIYLVALAAGHASGAPGGLGAFEAVLLLALPQVPVTDLAAAVVLYRAIYYGGPFAIALALVARPGPAAVAPVAPPCARVRAILADSGRAEAALADLGDKRFFLGPAGDACVMYGVLGRQWVVMGDPYGPRAAWPGLMDAYRAWARAAGARVAIYKADDAAFWRARGAWVQPLGEEGVLDLARFTLEVPERRELRRKLAQVRKAGVEIACHAPGAAPMADLARVAAAWRGAKRRREQTFSMGHFDPAFVARHHVLTARVAGECVAFLSVWVGGRGGEWSIDLMRQDPRAPMGTMHALVAEAVAVGARAGAGRFNLCMAPLSGLEGVAPVTPLSRLGAWVYARADARHGLQGLRRFKEMFRPDWRGRHLVADGPVAGVCALVAVARLVAGAARRDAAAPILAMPAVAAPAVAEPVAAASAVATPAVAAPTVPPSAVAPSAVATPAVATPAAPTTTLPVSAFPAPVLLPAVARAQPGRTLPGLPATAAAVALVPPGDPAARRASPPRDPSGRPILADLPPRDHPMTADLPPHERPILAAPPPPARLRAPSLGALGRRMRAVAARR